MKKILLFSLVPLAGCQVPPEDPLDLMSDTWVATDALGRQMPLQETVGPVKDGRHFTGIFYITWHGAGNHNLPGPYTDVTKSWRRTRRPGWMRTIRSGNTDPITGASRRLGIS